MPPWFTWREIAALSLFCVVILAVAMAAKAAQKPAPYVECADKVIVVVPSLPGEATCSHREHVLQRGREDGTLWLCICDAKGSEARRARP